MAHIYRATEGPSVFLQVKEPDGCVWTREFRVFKHDGPGYVWERQGQEWRQVCAGLTQTGSTLRCRAEALDRVIRQQYRAAVRANAAQEAQS